MNEQVAAKIRLMRRGKRGQPSYRVVVMDESRPRSGKIVADLGFYNPLEDKLQIETGQAMKWLKAGAQPTPTCRSLLKKLGVLAERRV